MSGTVDLDTWQWERLMEVLWRIEANTQPPPPIIMECTAKPEPIRAPEPSQAEVYAHHAGPEPQMDTQPDNKETAAGEWRHLATTAMVKAHRKGWAGAWDALVAAITGRPRLTVPTPMTASLWVKALSGQEVDLKIHTPQLEEGPQP